MIRAKKLLLLLSVGVFFVIGMVSCGTGEKESKAATGNLVTESVEETQEAHMEVESVEEVDLFCYHIVPEGEAQYVVITGIKEEYRENILSCLEKITGGDLLYIPAQIEGIPVKEIGEGAFENCGVSRVEFAEGTGETLYIRKNAFANNKDLWAVYIPNEDCVIEEGAFAQCAEECYLCYGEGTEGKENPVEKYAEENGLIPMEIVSVPSKETVIEYPETPFELTPEIRSFFYGENADEEHFCTFEYGEDATDYGFEPWHAPCGEFCPNNGWLEIEASSELVSEDDRYAAGNLKSGAGRKYAWAEGVEGVGIGECIKYHDSNGYGITSRWDGLPWEVAYGYDYPIDGYIRYTEICIVNGYAKDEKTWEENGRVKTLRMDVEDKPYAYLLLEDTILPQYFTLPPEGIKAVDGGEIHFEFVIEDVYPGTLYEDTCLTGLVLEFTGRHGH